MSGIIALSEAAVIGLHSMVLIADSEKIMNVTTIAEKIDSSKHHVAKVMQRLAKFGYVSSYRGPNGGFYLKKEPEKITLLNIYESIEGKIEIQTCPANKGKCPFGQCIMGDLTQKLANEFLNYLTTKTLKDYLKN